MMISSLISPEYLKEQQRLHELGGYGEYGDRWVTTVLFLMRKFKARSILDYGCGAGGLVRALGWYYISADEYDPALPDKASEPKPADFVVCTDVLEHIEPALLVNVMEHLYYLTRVALFVVISTRPAGKKLSDGSNAHLIIQKGKWWQFALDPYFSAKQIWRFQKDEWAAVMVPRNRS